MLQCAKQDGIVPQWYIAVQDQEIIAGIGIIDNDFHNRKDLQPNVCALYVEERYRCRGIAGKLLAFAMYDMKDQGLHWLYLVTEHCSFYERYGWNYLCTVKDEFDGRPMRLYERRIE